MLNEKSSLTKAIEAAATRGVRKALIDHKRNGDPIVIWRDGQVVWVPAEDIVIPDEPATDSSPSASSTPSAS